YNESQFAPLVRMDQLTGETKYIAYSQVNKEMRWNWNAPILISPHDPNTIFHAGNKLIKSANQGESWEVISPDLTTNNPEKIQGTGNIQYCTITSFDQSPIDKNVIWVGTDDGNVQLTKDGGKTWTKLNDQIVGNPEYWVSRIIASNHLKGRAYLTYTGYRRDDFRPFVYKTDDFGKTWVNISDGLPNQPVNVIREDRVNPELLFIGTEMGVYVSMDKGKHWSAMKNNMPTVPVHDLLIHPRESDLIVATHGRGIFITNIRPLQFTDENLLQRNFHLYKPREKVMWISAGNNNSAFTNYDGESEPEGLEVFYYSKVDEKVEVDILQGNEVIRTLEIDLHAGLNKFVWDLNKVDRKRTNKEKEEYLARAERMKDYIGKNRYEEMVKNADFVFAKTKPGNYKIRVKLSASSHEQEIVILQDLWQPK
ncbi:MAG: hypothetical protein OEY34_04550, partial [Cyclobacteriaceae bacterium]|nr:hypothetical protein [Cyclobacteriaceae bacterium]